MFDFIEIPAIVVICYLIAEIYKYFAKEEDYRLIPVLVGLCGALIGGLAFYLLDDFIVADNILDAIAIGIVSGFGATGINQISKQMGSDE